MKTEKIEQIHGLLVKNITTVNRELTYNQILEQLRLLVEAINDYKGNTEDWIYIGEDNTPIDALIVGSYWHLVDWNGGQHSITYKTLSLLGEVFNPGMSCLDKDNSEHDVYMCLEQLAKNNKGD